MAERAQRLTDLCRLSAKDLDLVTRFVAELPERDRTFLKEDPDADTIAQWCADERVPRWVVVGDDGEPQAMLSLHPGTLWSAHVGELRLVVGERFRRRGLGRRLARLGLAEAVRLGLRKVVVEVVAGRERDMELFTSIGFEPEALLRDHMRDHDGALHDLVILSHEVGDVSSSMDVLGLEDEIGPGQGG